MAGGASRTRGGGRAIEGEGSDNAAAVAAAEDVVVDMDHTGIDAKKLVVIRSYFLARSAVKRAVKPHESALLRSGRRRGRAAWARPDRMLE